MFNLLKYYFISTTALFEQLNCIVALTQLHDTFRGTIKLLEPLVTLDTATCSERITKGQNHLKILTYCNIIS